ncbi:MAG: SDR family oxidoreductase [Ignavibacteria bacterium]|nr:SDR family oxidoreductase [Ignavibacteria bacterium]
MSGIVITGVSGYLGPYLCRALAGKHDVYGIYNSHPVSFEGINIIKCNLTDFKELSEVFDRVKPDVVYHLASVTPTRITDESDGFVEFFNREVTAEIARLCAKHNSLMIYTSTDLVYDEGTGIEEDSAKLAPKTIYAKTKLMGERSVKDYASKYIVLRTALVYGFTLSSYTSFFDISYRAMAEGESVNAFFDQYRNPIYTEDAASILAELPAKYITNETINFCGSEFLSRYEMCLMMAEEFGFDPGLIKKVSCKEFTAYPLVEKLEMKFEKMKLFEFKTRSFREALKRSRSFII